MMNTSKSRAGILNAIRISACVMAAMAVFAAGTIAESFAAGESADKSVSDSKVTATYDVTDFGAVSSKKANGYKHNAEAFNAALGKAKNADGMIKVTVPKGTYHLKSPIRMYSNTWLLADAGAEIIADYYNDSSTMLSGFHLDKDGYNCRGKTCKHGGYTQLNNIIIEGGTWARSTAVPAGKNGSTSIFRFRHGQNITIRNMVCMNSASHFFNLSSTKNVLVENVTFKNSRKVTNASSNFWGATKTDREKNRHGLNKYNGVETIHFDICDGKGENGEQAMPFDCKPCRKATVRNCSFINVWSGVGNHHDAKKKQKRTSGIKVLDNTFQDIRWYAVYAIDFDDVTIRGNTIKNAEGIANLKGTGRTRISGNKYTVSKKRAGKFNAALIDPVLKVVDASGSGKITIQDNSIRNKTIKIKKSTAAVKDEDAILVRACNGAVISKNTIQSSRSRGILVRDSKKVTISGNKISKTAADALFLFGSRKRPCSATITGNDLNCAATGNTMGSRYFDLRLGSYAVRCGLRNNILRSGSFYAHELASYTDSSQ